MRDKSSGEVTRAIKSKASECVFALAVEDRFTIVSRVFLAIFHEIQGSEDLSKLREAFDLRKLIFWRFLKFRARNWRCFMIGVLKDVAK